MKVAVIGAGTMGSGIAQAFAQNDAVEKVYLCDIKQEFADGGKGKIKKQLDRAVAKGKMEQAKADAILAKVQTGLHCCVKYRLQVVLISIAAEDSISAKHPCSPCPGPKCYFSLFHMMVYSYMQNSDFYAVRELTVLRIRLPFLRNLAFYS